MNYNPNLRPKNIRSAGYLMVLVLVFSGIFFTIVTGFVGYVITQNKLVNFRYEQQRATEIAEAGLNYYKWFLAHYPGDLTTGVGVPHPYKDPVTGIVFGEFSLQVASTTYCGSIASIEVESTAFTYEEPLAVSTLRARYTRPNVAEYSFISNTGVWYGAGGSVVGPLHSNQGVRMDSAHNSIIGSGQTSWTCDNSYGCSPSLLVNGVYTTSGDSTPGLFSFPVSPIDFAGITLDLGDMKTRAQNNGGIYYGPSGSYGYEVVFNSNGTVQINRVTGTVDYQSYSSEQGTHTGERNFITSRVSVGLRNISASCPLLFFEDKVWVRGTVNQKVALGAGNLSSPSQTNIVLSGNIDYLANSQAGLLAIAEDDIDYGVDIPNNMTVKGIYIAKNGRVGRNYYHVNWFSNTLDPYVLRNRLDTFGTLVSNGRAVSTWVSGPTVVSGFVNGTDSFDSNQVDYPPPFTPETSDVFIFKDWRQD